MIYFTSDLHFNHEPCALKFRDMNSVEEHNNKIIDNINSVVTNKDDLYILGDLMLGDNDEGIKMLKRLNGNLYIVFGNHDTNNRILKYAEELDAEILGFGSRLKYKKWNFYLSHYPANVTNYDANKPLKQQNWNLCGHCHTNDKFQDIQFNAYHVELEAHNYYPVSIDNIITDIVEYKKESKNEN